VVLTTEYKTGDGKEALPIDEFTSGDLFEAILGTIGDGISVQDRDLRVIYANEAHRKMFGEDIVGKLCYRVYERRARPCPDCPVLAAMRTGETVRNIQHGIDRDDNVVVADISASPIFDASGEVVAGVEVVRDVTADFQARQELSGMTAKLKRLAAIAQEISSGMEIGEILEHLVRNAVQIIGADAGTVAILDEKRRMISYPYHYNMPEDLQVVEVPEGTGIAGLVISSGEPVMLDDYGSHEAHLESFRKAGVVGILAVPLAIGPHALGALGLFSNKGSKRFSEGDRETAMMIADQAAVAIDNARLLEKTREGLRVQRELNKVAASISSGLDLGKVLSHVARHAAEVVGAEAAMVALLDEERGQVTFPIAYNLPAHLKEVTTPAGRGLAGAAIASGRPGIVNDYQGYEDSNPEFVEAGVRAVATVPLQVSGRCVGAIGVMDITSDRQFNSEDIEVLSTISRQAAVAVDNARLYEEVSRAAEKLELRVKERTEALSRMYEESRRKSRELEEANLRLKEVDQLKSEFLANMSHELRTPLNSIIGFSKLIIDGLDGSLNSEQRRDLEIVYSSGQALTRLIDDLLNLAKIEAGRVALDIREEDPGKIVEEAVTACRTLARDKGLEIKYGIPGGLRPVRVDAARIRQVIRYLIENAVKFTEEGTIRVSIEQSTRKTVFAVADTGIGLEADQIEAVFERFHQVEPGMAEKGGMGLGLAISKRLVEMHGGVIMAESRLGQGSVFSFSIPDS